MQLAKYAISLKDDNSIDPEDPISSIVNLSKVQSLIVLSTEFLEQVDARVADMGIEELPIDF